MPHVFIVGPRILLAYTPFRKVFLSLMSLVGVVVFKTHVLGGRYLTSPQPNNVDSWAQYTRGASLFEVVVTTEGDWGRGGWNMVGRVDDWENVEDNDGNRGIGC